MSIFASGRDALLSFFLPSFSVAVWLVDGSHPSQHVVLRKLWLHALGTRGLQNVHRVGRLSDEVDKGIIILWWMRMLIPYFINDMFSTEI